MSGADGGKPPEAEPSPAPAPVLVGERDTAPGGGNAWPRHVIAKRAQGDPTDPTPAWEGAAFSLFYVGVGVLGLLRVFGVFGGRPLPPFPLGLVSVLALAAGVVVGVMLVRRERARASETARADTTDEPETVVLTLSDVDAANLQAYERQVIRTGFLYGVGAVALGGVMILLSTQMKGMRAHIDLGTGLLFAAFGVRQVYKSYRLKRRGFGPGDLQVLGEAQAARVAEAAARPPSPMQAGMTGLVALFATGGCGFAIYALLAHPPKPGTMNLQTAAIMFFAVLLISGVAAFAWVTFLGTLRRRRAAASARGD